MLPAEAFAHAKGLYKTQAEAEQRAKELGCNGTHLNNGLWMPCGHEAQLHKELRQE
ncbi:MAG: gibberellin regulated-like protein [Cyanobacteria bacterium K_DeepCast_0m_m1_088]|nr:gibberellin regulated-like protein [Cyanobacteria bacterium K_DeepCast_0m_m1_088]